MKVFTDPKKLQAWARKCRLKSKCVALVPTMGYLHDGHLSLIEAAKKKGADEIIVSIFVNPVQFGPNEDFEKYPRDEKSDLRKCRMAGATAVFFPTPENMYDCDHSTFVEEVSLSGGLCGARRPGHFRGVATVVAKLFNLAHPDFAVFGQKDYQQVQVIKRMVRDLNFDLEIVVAPIVRESSGLAMSSRNTYLSDKEREQAVVISRELSALKSKPKTTLAIKKSLERAGLTVDYVECVDSETLKPVRGVRKGTAVLVAAFCGKTRLIDNIVL
jgi:pantoate--beta-alanine ligase